MPSEQSFLNGAYTLESAQDTQDLYAAWAKTYEAEMQQNGYASPDRTAKALLEASVDVSKPLLDLGCGTGLSGVALNAAGFQIIDGSDFSDEMLAAAASKNLYRTLTKADLTRPIPSEPGQYATITAIGVFSPGHAPAMVIHDVISLMPPGGLFAFSLNDHAIEETSYEETITKLQDAKKIDILSSAYGDHMPGIGLKAKIYVIRCR